MKENSIGIYKPSRVEEIKKIIKEHYVDCGIFDCKSNGTFGIDKMHRLYDKDGVTVDVNYEYEYFEVIGLTPEEFEEVRDYYYY